jgi:hypothetical protein
VKSFDKSLNSTLIFTMVISWIALSCEESVPFDCDETTLELEVLKTKNPDCGLSDGEITVVATGGNAPYTYAIDDGPFTSSPFFENVQPVLHDLSVMDNTGCVLTIKYFLAGKDPFQVVVYTTPSGCGGNNGTIRLVPLGGVPPMKYQLGENNDDYQESPLWENLLAGRHSVWVEDINECFFGVYAEVRTGVSYKNQISPILSEKCSSASCHGGTIAPDLSSYSGVKMHASAIKSLINSNVMPPTEPLSGADKSLIVCWIDDGAINN